MTDKTTDFERSLSALVSKELRGDPDAVGILIERLINSLGLAIAVSSRGDNGVADRLLQGAEGYLAECIAMHSKLAAFMNKFHVRKEAP